MVAPHAAQPLPALGLPPEALVSLRSAFAREVAVRLPRLLALVPGSDASGPRGSAKTDATMLAEGCTLLGDAAGARALHRLGDLLDSSAGAAGDPAAARDARREAASTAALLLGRWVDARPED